MSKASSRETSKQTSSKPELAALSTLLGVMFSASRLSEQLLALSDQMGPSVDKLMETAGLSIEELEDQLDALKAQRGRERSKKPRQRKSAKAA